MAMNPINNSSLISDRNSFVCSYSKKILISLYYVFSSNFELKFSN